MSICLGALLLLAIGSPDAQPAGLRRIVDPREVIALEAGIWDAVITTPPRIAGGMPTTATGVQINEVRSGGLWMLNRMSVNGGAYEGTGFWGHDPKTGRYSGAWVDDGTGRIRLDDGTWDPETSTMTWTSQVERRDGRSLRIRATSTFLGSTRTYRSFAITDDGEQPLSTVVFARRQNSQFDERGAH